MTEQQQKILDLAKNSLFLSEELREKIQNNIENLSVEKMKELGNILLKAETKQKLFLEQALENNPNLLFDISSISAQEKKKLRAEQEKISNQKDAEILHSIEKIFNA